MSMSWMKSGRVLALSCMLAACKTTSAYPSRQDLVEVTEAKPMPGADILTDPAAGDRYDSAIEGWGDRLAAAGGRLCRHFSRTGMKVVCPPPPPPSRATR